MASKILKSILTEDKLAIPDIRHAADKKAMSLYKVKNRGSTAALSG